MDLLTALKNFATAVVSRSSQDDIDAATEDLHATINPGAADASQNQAQPVKLVNTAG